MVRRLGRKGTSMEEKLYFVLWEMIIFVLVFFVIMFCVRAAITNSGYWKKYYSADVALIADLENTNQGDFVINYELKDHNKIKFFSFIFSPVIYATEFIPDQSFEFYLKEDAVFVYDASENTLKNPRSYPYAKASSVEVEENLLMADFFVISKKGSLMQISQADYEFSSCPSFDTSRNISEIRLTATVIGKEDMPQRYTQAASQLFKSYGAAVNAPKDLTIVFTKDPASNMTIYYYSDKAAARAEKFACILEQEYSKEFAIEELETRRYDGFLDADSTFNNILGAKGQQEMLIIVRLAATGTSNPDDAKVFASVMTSTLDAYYGATAHN